MLQHAADPGLTTADAIGRWLLAISTVIVVGVLVRRLRASAVASEARFRLGFQGSAVGAAVLAADGRFTDVNQALCRMLDLPRADLLTRTAAQVSHPEDVTRMVAALERAQAERTPQHFVKRCIRRDGQVITAAVDATWIEDGSEGHFIVHAQDITDQVAAQAALERRARQQEIAADLGRVALGEPDLSRVLYAAVDHARDALGLDLGTLTLRAPDGDAERVAAARGWEPGAGFAVVPETAASTLSLPILGPERTWADIRCTTAARARSATTTSRRCAGSPTSSPAHCTATRPTTCCATRRCTTT